MGGGGGGVRGGEMSRVECAWPYHGCSECQSNGLVWPLGAVRERAREVRREKREGQRQAVVCK